MRTKFKLVVALFSLTIVLFYISCKKNELPTITENATNTENNFFTLHRSNDALEKSLVEYIFKENSKLHFTEKTVNQIGYPRWDKISGLTKNNTSNNSFKSIKNADTTIYYVPFVRDNQNFVNAAMLIKISANADTTFSYIQDCSYKAKQNTATSINDNAEYYAIFFMTLTKNVFGYKKFKITDPDLFKDGNKKNISVTIDNAFTNSNGAKNLLSSCATTTISWQDCPYTICNGEGGSCDGCDECTSSISWTYCGGDGGGWPTGGGGGNTGGSDGGGSSSGGGSSGGGSSGGSSSGGGSSGWAPIVFNPAVTYIITTMGADGNEPAWFASSMENTIRAVEIKNYLVQHNNSAEAIDFCWLHLTKMMNDPTYLNFVDSHPNDIQSAYYSYLTEVENDLVNNPCLKGITNAITKGKHQTLVYDLFKKEQATAKPKFPLKFRFEEVASLPSPAATQDGYLYDSPTTISAGIMIIKLNTGALAGKSREWITSVILHELCHAITKAITVNANFPKPIPVITQEDEHKEMIKKKYPLDIYNNLTQIFPNANVEEMKDLAVGGFAGVLFSNGILLNNPSTQQITGAEYFPGLDIFNAYTNTIPSYKDLTKGTICN